MQTALPEAVGSPGPSGESLPARSFCSQISHHVFLLAGCIPALSSAASHSDSTNKVTQQFNCNSAYMHSIHYTNVFSSADAEQQRTQLRSLIKGNSDLYFILQKLIPEPTMSRVSPGCIGFLIFT